MPRAKDPTTPLGRELRALRADAGLRAVDVAKTVGIAQASLSRYETGEQLPPAVVVRELCGLYTAGQDTLRRLLRLVTAAAAGPEDADEVRKRGGHPMQDRVDAVTEAAQVIRSWNVTTVAGENQTRAYAIAMFGEDFLSPDDVARTVDARLRRRRFLTSGRTFWTVHSEAALMWGMGGPTVMVEQLDQLIADAALPDVNMGAVPFEAAATVPADHDYTLYDRNVVHFGTVHETLFVTHPPHIALYRDRWAEVQPLIVWGAEAVAVFERVRSRYAAL